MSELCSWAHEIFDLEIATSLGNDPFFFILPYLSSVHEKANYIAIFWTGRSYSLGSCHFKTVWATCLRHLSDIA